MKHQLDFEKPIVELQQKLEELKKHPETHSINISFEEEVALIEKKIEETKSTGTVVIEGVEVDAKRSFTEVYASTPEPKIPVWITYHWKVFRARGTTARLTVSDWSKENEPGVSVGLEQTFNFLEIQPYRE